MKILNIIEELAEITPENAASQTRDEALRNMTKWGKKLALSALPTGLLMFAFSDKVKAGTVATQDALAVLNFALTLEYLESDFYNQGVAAPGLIPSSDLPVFQQIKKHEAAHVTLLISAITGAGGSPIATPNFDFTGGHSATHTGPYQPFLDYNTFLILSQGFEDTGVRAYKGQAGNLMGSANYATLTTALRIHSVEARHAAEVRRIRGQKGWITQHNQSDSSFPAAFAAIYSGEDNLSQGGISNVSSIDTVGADAMTEGFDEPLDEATVRAIAANFIYP